VATSAARPVKTTTFLALSREPSKPTSRRRKRAAIASRVLPAAMPAAVSSGSSLTALMRNAPAKTPGSAR
jgi:hypothetical protein